MTPLHSWGPLGQPAQALKGKCTHPAMVSAPHTRARMAPFKSPREMAAHNASAKSPRGKEAAGATKRRSLYFAMMNCVCSGPNKVSYYSQIIAMPPTGTDAGPPF